MQDGKLEGRHSDGLQESRRMPLLAHGSQRCAAGAAVHRQGQCNRIAVTAAYQK